VAISDEHGLVASQPIHLTVHEAPGSNSGRSSHKVRGCADGGGEPSAIFSGDPRRFVSLEGKLTVLHVAELIRVSVLSAVDIIEDNSVVDCGKLSKNL